MKAAWASMRENRGKDARAGRPSHILWDLLREETGVTSDLPTRPYRFFSEYRSCNSIKGLRSPLSADLMASMYWPRMMLAGPTRSAGHIVTGWRICLRWMLVSRRDQRPLPLGNG